jgi:import inner membrane translocase subunit TIM23
MNVSSGSNDDDAGAPLPDFSAHNIQLQTVIPSLAAAPDYLDFDPKGRGIIVTMFANTGMSYLLGTTAGGVYGFREGLKATPNTRFRVQLNSVLNHCGRYGSRAGNTMGVFAVLYSLSEGLADQLDIEDKLKIRAISPAAASMFNPALAATVSGLTYFAPSGPRAAGLAGALAFSAVASTYTAYSILGIPYGSKGFLWT